MKQHLQQVRIGRYLAATDTETYRIFPKNAKGESIPVTRINHFLYLRSQDSGELVVFKRYWHMREWHWRDSRDKEPCSEAHVMREIARMLFRGDVRGAKDLWVYIVAGISLSVMGEVVK